MQYIMLTWRLTDADVCVLHVLQRRRAAPGLVESLRSHAEYDGHDAHVRRSYANVRLADAALRRLAHAALRLADAVARARQHDARTRQCLGPIQCHAIQVRARVCWECVWHANNSVSPLAVI